MPTIHNANLTGALSVAGSPGTSGQVLKSAGVGATPTFGHDDHSLLSNLLGLSPYHHLPAPTIPCATFRNVAGVDNGDTNWDAKALFGTGTPANIDTAAAAGTSLSAARVDHVHAAVLSSFTAGSVLFAGIGGAIAQDNANLFWDNTNNRLGIGTTSPATQLDVLSNNASNIRLTSVAGRGCSLLSYGVGAGDSIFISANAYYDGSNWQRIETGGAGWLAEWGVANGDFFSIQRVASGANPISSWTELFRVNSTGVVTVADTINAVRSSGTAQFAIDGTSQGSAITIANNNYATPFTTSKIFSGLVLVSDTNVSGETGVFLVAGGVTLIAGSTSVFTTTGGTASRINLFITGSEIRLENKLGSSLITNVVAIRSRVG